MRGKVHMILMDNGSQLNITNNIQFLHKYRKFKEHEKFAPSDTFGKDGDTAQGKGTIILDFGAGYIFHLPAYYIPSSNKTIISENKLLDKWDIDIISTKEILNKETKLVGKSFKVRDKIIPLNYCHNDNDPNKFLTC